MFNRKINIVGLRYIMMGYLGNFHHSNKSFTDVHKYTIKIITHWTFKRRLEKTRWLNNNTLGERSVTGLGRHMYRYSCRHYINHRRNQDQWNFHKIENMVFINKSNQIKLCYWKKEIRKNKETGLTIRRNVE